MAEGREVAWVEMAEVEEGVALTFEALQNAIPFQIANMYCK